MCRGVTVKTFQFQRHSDQTIDRRVFLAHFLQHGLVVERLLQANRVGRVVGDQLADPVHLTVRHFEHPADVAQHRARFQLTEGDYLGDPVETVFLLHVADNVVAPVLTEIDVEIRHRHAFRVEKTFEQQIETQRIEIGDGQRPGNHRSSTRAASRPHRNVLVLRPLDKVGDDQEISRKAHLRDDIELVLYALAIWFRGRLALFRALPFDIDLAFKPFFQSRRRHLAQHFLLATPFQLWIRRQDRRPRVRHVGTALRDDERVRDRLGQIGEQFAHFFRRLEIMFGRDPPPVGPRHGRPGSDAHQRIMRFIHAPVGEKDLVGRDQGDIVRVGHLDKGRFDLLFVQLAVPHQFNIQAAIEQLLQPHQHFLRSRPLTFDQQAADRTADPTGQCDQSGIPRFEVRKGDLRRILRRGVKVGPAHEIEEIAVSLLRLRQQHEPIAGEARAAKHARIFALYCDLTPNDRLNALRSHREREFQGTEKISGIRNADGRHVVLRTEFGQVGNLDRALGQREGIMDSEMNEIRMRHTVTPWRAVLPALLADYHTVE